MREKDSGARARAREASVSQRGGEEEHTREIARVPEYTSRARFSLLFLSPASSSSFPRGRTEGETFPINTAWNGRMNAGKNRRMTNCSKRSSGALAFSPRFQRIFERRRAVSPLDSPLLQEFLSTRLSLALSLSPSTLSHIHTFSLFLSLSAAKHPSSSRKLRPKCIERSSSSHDEIPRRNYERPGVDRGNTMCSRLPFCL